MTTDTARTRQLRAELVRTLVDAGYLSSPEWQRAFRQVPRHLFVPCFYGDTDSSGELIDGTRPEHEDRWLAAVYMRGHWPPRPSVSALIELSSAEGTTRPATDADDLLLEEPIDATICMLLRLVLWMDLARIDVRSTQELYVDRFDYSWALLDYETGQIKQGGPRRMWDEAVRLHQEWCALGGPARERFGITVTADRHQYVWLDAPSSGRRWDLAGGAGDTWWTSPPLAVATYGSRR